jgi:ABC-2 type transport system ATP-binding protein
MLSFRGLSKHYGPKAVLDDLTFDVLPGRVTGFLGPNGAGKSTTLRILVGLVHPSAGEALVRGRPYSQWATPARIVGVHLDGHSFHPGRSARAHLLGLARYSGLPAGRVPTVLEQVGLSEAAGRRAGTFSLGMTQRLGLAAALLGDPEILVLDEPVNGLDSDGVRWIRLLLRSLAAEGRTVLVSSHLMSEMRQTADQLVVIGRGRLLADCPTQELVDRATSSVLVASPDPVKLGRLAQALVGAGGTIARQHANDLEVTQLATEIVGDLAFVHQVPLHRLAAAEATLEAAYLQLAEGAFEYAAHGAPSEGSGS